MSEPISLNMLHYWARFQTVGEDVFRYDTRIYLQSTPQPHVDDVCIGAIVAKNPGSAKAADPSNRNLQKIALDGDKMLPTVRSIVLKAFELAGQEPKPGEYVQVLNLFYLCEPQLNDAITRIKYHRKPKHCPTETNSFPWIWYAWGGESHKLNEFKSRHADLNSDHHFYFDKHADKIQLGFPDSHAFAKHTQGLAHEKIIQDFAKILCICR